MRLYSLHANTQKYYHAQILNNKDPYYLEFVHDAPTRTSPLLIGDFPSLLSGHLLERKHMNNSTPTFSSKAFDLLKEILHFQSIEIVKLHFENRIFYVASPQLLIFTDTLNWKKMSDELPENVSFFREESGIFRALVTQPFKDICDQKNLKGMMFDLKYDSETLL